MKEIEDIIRAFTISQQQNKKTALATVVHVEGSSYRRPGARMLVTEDGELTGAISGGCLEGDALRKALLAINQQQNKLVTYNSMDEEDNTIGIQLGCNGIVHILFEPINTRQQNHPVALLEKSLSLTDDAVVVTLFSLDARHIQPGTCLLTTNKEQYGDMPAAIKNVIRHDIDKVFKNKSSVIQQYQFTNEPPVAAFIELLKPPVKLIIAGAGNDAFPVVQMAKILGWHITVVDGRKTHATTNRFAGANQIIIGKPGEAVEKISITGQTVAVLMSHNYNYDAAFLKELVNTNCTYIGVLGPKKKLEKMLTALQDEGIHINDADKVYGPVGLDIGAETPEEIALSVMAEIQAVLSQKNGAALRDKKGCIHAHSTHADVIIQ